MTRHLGELFPIVLASLAAWNVPPAVAGAERRPDVVLIITDDQGYGDLGCHGNTSIRTPNLDRFASESVRLSRFYVSPVCSPTRSSLITGRYNYRTGVVDTYLGRSLMHPAEVTLAERLARAGFRTGLFGKWHLGDNAPLRPIDRGFQRTLVHKGGGIGQPSDLPGGTHYLDPVLLDDGAPRAFKGYCSDIYTDAAIEFLGRPGDQPRFVMLAYNCPHAPLEAPEAELKAYEGLDLDRDLGPADGYPLPPRLLTKLIARLYAMVTNVDRNVGRLLESIDRAGRRESTIVLFMTDNGPQFARYNAGLRGLKGSTYDGGIHVPCYVRWPGQFPAGSVVDRIAAHIDLAPTLLEACAIPPTGGPPMDGRSLVPLLRGSTAAPWPDRTLFFQWHRGDSPEEGRAFAARTQSFKLLRAEPEKGNPPGPLELYDMDHDPYEKHDLAGARPDLVTRLYEEYRRWFRDVCSTRGFKPIPVRIGDPREDPVLLTRQDWREQSAGDPSPAPHHWVLEVAEAGSYDAVVSVPRADRARILNLLIGGRSVTAKLPPGESRWTFHDLSLIPGPGRLQAWAGDGIRLDEALDVEVGRKKSR